MDFKCKYSTQLDKKIIKISQKRVFFLVELYFISKNYNERFVIIYYHIMRKPVNIIEQKENSLRTLGACVMKEREWN